MRILIVAASEEEVGGLRPGVSQTQDSGLKTQDLHILITGVGMTATAFAMGRHLATNQYDLAVNLGIAGSFDKTIALGEVVEITEDTFADLGADDDGEFLSIEQLGFGKNAYRPSTNLSRYYNSSYAQKIQSAKAITVNTVTGSEVSIKRTVDRLNPQIESMEGAAFFYACREMNLPCLQIRAVSNYVERRNRDNWKIGLAIKNLNTFALKFLKAL